MHITLYIERESGGGKASPTSVGLEFLQLDIFLENTIAADNKISESQPHMAHQAETQSRQLSYIEPLYISNFINNFFINFT